MKLVPLVVEQQWIPQRLVQRLPPHFLLWTFRQRTVFALVDGERSTTYIAHMLSTSHNTVIQTHHELQELGMVAKEKQRHGHSTQQK